MTPQIRQWIYTISAIASALIPLLVTYKVLDPNSGSAWTNLVGVLGAIGTGGAVTAAAVVAKQRRNGTILGADPAQQAITAIQATIDRATSSVGDLEKVRSAVSEVLGATNPALNVVDLVSGGLADQLVQTVVGEKDGSP